MARGHRGSLLLRRRALPSPSPCRFIPALSMTRGHRGSLLLRRRAFPSPPPSRFIPAHPLRSTPITGASSLLRAGPPARPATVLTPDLTPGHSLSQTKLIHSEPISPSSVGTHLPTFPARAADQAHATSMPDTAWPETGLPARPCSHSPGTWPWFRCHSGLTTHQQRFGVTHLPGPHLTPHGRLFHIAHHDAE